MSASLALSPCVVFSLESSVHRLSSLLVHFQNLIASELTWQQDMMQGKSTENSYGQVPIIKTA